MMLDHVVHDAHEKSFFELKKNLSEKKIYDITWNRQIPANKIEIWKVVELEKFSETDFSELEFGGSEFLISIFTFDSH